MLVALLRGVNVGGRNRLPMGPLREALTALGVVSVRTYLQSGNVVGEHADPVRFGTLVRDVIASDFGLDIPVIVRSHEELQAVLAWNPFPGPAVEKPKLVHVSFLAETPDPERLAVLEELESDDDEWAIRGKDLVVSYDRASHDSPLGRGIAKVLGVGVTARNWSTVEALAELTR